jgi:CRISPR-associated protein Cmr4
MNTANAATQKDTPQRLYIIHALTPIHIGVDDALGSIDLPTLRERHTGFPLVPGSSVKGVLRQAAELDSSIKANEVLFSFGPDRHHAGDYRGGLVLTDAQLLALPVRSLSGTFAWVTCGHVLSRLNRDLASCGLPLLPKIGNITQQNESWVPKLEPEKDQRSALLIPSAQKVFLEEMLLDAEERVEAQHLSRWISERAFPDDAASRAFFDRRLLIVHDDVFAFFARVGLEVRTRVRIDQERGTAADSGPWTEEHIPAEAILCGLALGRSTFFKPQPDQEPKGEKKSPRASLNILEKLIHTGALLRFGGHATIGLGRARFRLTQPTEAIGGQP